MAWVPSVVSSLFSKGLQDIFQNIMLPMQIFADGAPFDYGVTLSDAVDMPVNLGMQFVPRGRYLNAIGFLNDVIAIYPFNETFIAGQVRIPSASHLPPVRCHRDDVFSFWHESLFDVLSVPLLSGRTHEVAGSPDVALLCLITSPL